MQPVYYKKRIEGVCVPAIIHNSSYFLIAMAVYEDGTVSCWHKSDLRQLQDDLKRGWLTPSIPAGQPLLIHGLGAFPVEDARWRHNAGSFAAYIKEVVRTLNPDMENIYRTTSREQEKWKRHRVSWSATPVPYKLREGVGYFTEDGSHQFLFRRGPGGLSVTSLSVYSDKTFRLGEEEGFFTLEEIDAMLCAGELLVSPASQEWVEVEGLGRLLLAPAKGVSLREKRKELAELARRTVGEEDAHDRCVRAYHSYLEEPSEGAREFLRQAYEAVPEHERMYLGDMDTRDSDYIRILYHPQDKREV